MKSVLVLGGTGMLGSMVTDELARRSGIQLTATWRAANRIPEHTSIEGVSWVPFDAADPDRLSDEGVGEHAEFHRPSSRRPAAPLRGNSFEGEHDPNGPVRQGGASPPYAPHVRKRPMSPGFPPGKSST